VILDNPYTGELIAEVPFISQEEAIKKMDKARDAYKLNKQNNLN
jgi:acyl-CoA reductase-like NAD-dependent aldehyde dehydrogenase